MVLLEVLDLFVSYGKAAVLQGISLTLENKDLFALIGPNGVGKTTLLRAISGLTPGHGDIKFMGERLQHLSPDQIVKKGVVLCPERRRLFSEMNVLRNLEMGAYLRKDKEGILSDMEKIFTLFPMLRERKNKRAATLSGGEQQILAVTRALMSKPKLLMLDEPSFGLAPLIKKLIIEILQKIEEEGITILLAEQDARMAFKASNRIFVMESGKIALQGDQKDLMANPHLQRTYLGLS